MNNAELSEIQLIQFGVLSPQDILKMSVCKIDNPKINGPNSVYDERMGTMDNKKCITCTLDMKECPGHFGHIELSIPILHPLYHRMIIIFLKTFCHRCFNLCISKEQLEVEGFIRLKGEARVNKIVEKVKKVQLCVHCYASQPKITYAVKEKEIYLVQKHNKDIQKILLKVDDIKNIFDNIPDDEITLFGLNPKHIHPKNFVLTILPVLPPRARPYILTDGIICDDDLTITYCEITKTNQYLQNIDLPEQKRSKYTNILNFRIKSLFCNSDGKAKHTNGRAIKGIKERLCGKEGLVRSSLCGKRCDGSARTVISPDPTLKVGEVAIPMEIASNLVFPERVCKYNIHVLTDIVNNNKANFVVRGDKRINLRYALCHYGTEVKYGDVIKRGEKEILIKSQEFTLRKDDILTRDGIKIAFELPKKKNFNLQMGDIVERQLRNGDVVVINRAPTLHGAGLLAHRIVVRPCKTFRFNLSSCTQFNADFDGDEMNAHTPSSYESLAELQLLSTPYSKYMNPQSGSAYQKIVQDTLLGAYLMTGKDVKISKAEFFNFCMRLVDSKGDSMTTDYLLKKIKHIKAVLKKMDKPSDPFTGRGMFSMFLPLDFNLIKKTEGEETHVKIYKGVLYEGKITKSFLNGGHHSIVQLLHKEYGPNVAIQFLNNIQFICCDWVGNHGFSIGIADFIPNKSSEIVHAISKGFIQAQGIEETTSHPIIKEVRIAGALSNARDVGMRIAKDAVSEDNNIVKTIISGAKGDFPNLSQIIGLLGQQNISGKRVESVLNKGKRTLIYYPEKFEDKKLEYESKGFISSSFIKGLNPKEFFFHAMSGREGISSTSMKTATSGYLFRRMTKVMEDVQAKPDTTVRDASGQIIQFTYGYDGFDGGEIIVKDGKSLSTDIPRLVDKLNMKHEKTSKIR